MRSLFKGIDTYCQASEKKFKYIAEERQEKLCLLAKYIKTILQREQTPKLITVCTHNSRRSHFAQIWLSVGTKYYNLPNLEVYSGGTETTALNYHVINCLKTIGFDINTEKTASTNPIYNIKWANNMQAYRAFSKCYYDAPNPKEEFGAILVCDNADKGCPFVEGANFCMALTYKDPKLFDNTTVTEEKYAETCREINVEMLYALNLVSKHYNNMPFTAQK